MDPFLWMPYTPLYGFPQEFHRFLPHMQRKPLPSLLMGLLAAALGTGCLETKPHLGEDYSVVPVTIRGFAPSS